ncbi:uncharacterized protein [Euwallacea similis]|uniref:uncharacterized protein n=1 Tax=Euwallacea similis TaxID=1736056 RepID=UPI00344D85DF
MTYLIEICLLLAAIQSALTIKCYSCNVSTSTADEDGCNGIGTFKYCPAVSVCLAATYKIKSGIVETYTTMQSCFVDMAGQECDSFFKSQKDLLRNVAIIPETCYSCPEDNCNVKKNKSSFANVLNSCFTGIVVSVLGCLLFQFAAF